MTAPHILVIDDEPHQLDTVCRGLRLYGYRCEGVSSVDSAIDALSRDQDIDLLLTDLTLPGRSGIELIEWVRTERPALPIVVITGLAASAELAFVRDRHIPLLPKPFDPDTLDATLRRALGKRGRSQPATR
jgi:DNA-binding NtrC family response regulator